VDAFELSNYCHLVEGIHHQHGKQRRLEVIAIGLGFGQLHE